jgi:hypothetical protein
LPGGTSISVELTTPADGALLANAPFQATGFATVGESGPLAQTTMAYVVDVSGSTASSNGCGGDQNGDGNVNTVLDCEIAALIAVNDLGIATGTIADVGAAAFASLAATADVGPAGGMQLLTGPDTDANSNAVRDIDEVLRSMTVGHIGQFEVFDFSTATSFGAGLAAIAPVLAASTQPNKIVVFVSDGQNNTDPNIFDVLPLPGGTVVHTFAIGLSSACDADTEGLGSLQDIADATGGTCTNVPDVADLPDVIPGVITSQLLGLQLTADGVPIPIDTIIPSLPEDGPISANYTTEVSGLAPGEHELCITATGSDALGMGHVQECKTIHINRPPEALCQDVSVSADEQCRAVVVAADIDDGSTDPDLGLGDSFACEIDPPGAYPVGVTQATLTCTDSFGETDVCEAAIEIVDQTPPELETLDILASVWPPNHQYQAFSIEDCVVSLTDNCDPDLDPATALTIVNVTSDEAELELGSGNTCDDIRITGSTTFEVRAERSDAKDGRRYTATFVATDEAGNATQGSCQVLVPGDQDPQTEVVDSGCHLCVGDDCGGCSLGDLECG